MSCTGAIIVESKSCQIRVTSCHDLVEQPCDLRRRKGSEVDVISSDFNSHNLIISKPWLASASIEDEEFLKTSNFNFIRTPPDHQDWEFYAQISAGSR